MNPFESKLFSLNKKNILIVDCPPIPPRIICFKFVNSNYKFKILYSVFPPQENTKITIILEKPLSEKYLKITCNVKIFSTFLSAMHIALIYVVYWQQQQRQKIRWMSYLLARLAKGSIHTDANAEDDDDQVAFAHRYYNNKQHALKD